MGRFFTYLAFILLLAHSIIPHKHQSNEENSFYIKSEYLVLKDIPSFLAGLVSQDIGENHLSNYKQPENSKFDFSLSDLFIITNNKYFLTENFYSTQIHQFPLNVDEDIVSKAYSNTWNFRGPPCL